MYKNTIKCLASSPAAIPRDKNIFKKNRKTTQINLTCSHAENMHALKKHLKNIYKKSVSKQKYVHSLEGELDILTPARAVERRGKPPG